MSQVIIIGGGAAGMLAAIAAAKNKHSVTIFEKNEKLGKKIFITGKGRCNVTNACDLDDFFQNIVRNKKFMYSSIYGFDNQSLMNLMEEAGCSLKIERGERVFPVSDHSSDIIKALVDQLHELSVTIQLNSQVQKIIEKDKKCIGIQLKNGQIVKGDAVIVATGGLSYPTTGSTGDGYEMAKKTGHKVIALQPSLVPFNIKESWCKELQGLALKNVTATLMNNGKAIYSEMGEMLFTHFGVSGPLILSASSYYENNSSNSVISIDLKPALTEEQLDKRILRDFEENQNKQFKNSLNKLFPSKLIPVMIELSGINPDKKINEISKEERKKFVKQIKNMILTIIDTRSYNEAIITKGGIAVSDINPSTMESKIISNLYFVGEVLDVDGLTGGFNLQIAFSTGYAAGSSIE